MPGTSYPDVPVIDAGSAPGLTPLSASVSPVAAAGARVLLVAPQPFFELRGTPLNVLQMLQVLCAAGYEVHLVTFAGGSPVEVPGLRHHRAPRVPWARSVPIGFSARKVANDVALALRVAQLVLTRRFQMVHAVEESVFFALPLASLRGIPVIYDLDSCLSDQLSYGGTLRNPLLLRAVRLLERAALRRARLALTVCQALTDVVRELAPGVTIAQIEDCPQESPPHPPTVDRLRAEYNPERRPLAVYTGNFAAYQGLDLLYDALPALAATCPEARVLLVGGTAQEVAEARLQLARRGTAHQVIFAGQQPPERMVDFLALADALVSPRREGTNTPLKIYGYMESGIPIVATRLPTHLQVLDEASAMLAAPEPAAFGHALGQVLAQPDTYQARGAEARARVRRDYSRDAFARKLLDAYDLVLGTRATVARSI